MIVTSIKISDSVEGRKIHLLKSDKSNPDRNTKPNNHLIDDSCDTEEARRIFGSDVKMKTIQMKILIQKIITERESHFDVI